MSRAPARALALAPVLALVAALVGAAPLAAQDSAAVRRPPADSLRPDSLPADSLRPDSLRGDSAAAPVARPMIDSAPLVLPPAGAADSAAEVRADSAAADSAGRRPPGAMGSFWRSFLVPGWGQLRLGRKWTAGLFVAAEAVTLGMSIKQQRDLDALRDRGADSVTIAEKKASREDWLVLLGFNHLVAGLEAYISAHLTDFPRDLQLRAVPGGVAGTYRMPFRLR